MANMSWLCFLWGLVSASQKLVQETCDLELSVFPYEEQKDWGARYYGWEACGWKSQSPIDIVTSSAFESDLVPIAHKWASSESVHFKNSGHSTQAYIKSDKDPKPNFGQVTVDSKIYTTQQVHFHTPSEHTVDGSHKDAEMHVVSTDPASAIAVVGVLFEVGAENECLKKVWGQVPKAGCEVEVGVFDLSCLDVSGPYYSYKGSLTTPPCSETVSWSVMQEYVTLSETQLKQLKKRYPNGNNRAIQPLNGRKVTVHTPTGQEDSSAVLNSHLLALALAVLGQFMV